MAGATQRNRKGEIKSVDVPLLSIPRLAVCSQSFKYFTDSHGFQKRQLAGLCRHNPDNSAWLSKAGMSHITILADTRFTRFNDMAQISKKQMAKLFHRLATGYKAGLDLRTLYKKESETGSPRHRMKSKQILTDVGKGGSLSKAMDRSDYFPPLAIAIVDAGEKGGRLDEAFRRLSNHYDNLVRFRNNFLQSIAWPCFELGASIVILGLLLLVLGLIVGSNPNAKSMDGFGTGYTFHQLFYMYCVFILVVGSGLFLLIYGSIKGWFGQWPMKIARRIPLVGKTIEALALSRFSWTLSIAENAGMQAVDMAKLAVRSTENYFYARHEDEICNKLQAGNAFYPVLKSTRAFPEDLLIYVDNGEVSGELAESMFRASAELQERAERNMKLIGTIGWAMMLSFVAIIIGGTVIFLYYSFVIKPINDLL